MANLNRLLNKKKKLNNKYKQLIEEAYNLRQTDHALSDFSEFKATKILNKLNKIEFIERSSNLQTN
ncbi:Lacal_2735 family protein [Winogradskyella bathintestinalis]|uniref:Lacal_2735 family protein n=1 Tax=Winogradskyella bathintestinalis TaxID=3035208 RepID=A0ABT7ZUM1_9FLAO|nr:Lacal_2735 family protein [Winogradskyella bathintestinalis]MDN3492705.1 Lacal_2735 family protein [Winogradskyella bathintestinalis]